MKDTFDVFGKYEHYFSPKFPTALKPLAGLASQWWTAAPEPAAVASLLSLKVT